MFRTVSLFIIRSLALYTQQVVYVILKFQKLGKITSLYLCTFYLNFSMT